MMFLLARAAVVVFLAGLFFTGGCRTSNAQATRPLATQPASQPVAAPLARYEYAQRHMGVQARLVLYAPSEQAGEDAARAAFARIAQLDAVASDYRKDSEAMRLCEKTGGEAVPVSEDLYRLLDYSIRAAQASDGGFDCTVGPLVALWRSARKSGQLPTAQQIEQAKRLVGYQNIKLDPAKRTAQLLLPGMKLDFGGIAKGYAGDVAIATLKARGIGSALFEAGGDIVLGNPPPGREGWNIEVLGGKPNEFVTLSNCAISMSGDTEQFVVIGGKRYSHVVDPRTGVGLTSHTLSTVIAPEGIVADALSTACGVTGPQGAAALEKAFPGAKIRVAKAPD